MTGRVIKLMVSARDSGAAQNLTPVIRDARTDPRFQVTVVADGAAKNVFSSKNISFETAENRHTTLAEAGQFLVAHHCPDAILAGGSGPGTGIDEALIVAGRGRPCFVLQDYWADVNPAIRGADVVFFVIDEKAGQLSWDLHRAKTVVSGPPKYRDYQTLDLWTRSVELREKLGIAADRPIACFFGQAGLPPKAYARTVAAFFAAASVALENPILCFRRHPNEPPGALVEIERATAVSVADASRGTAEEWLSLAAISASCFSNSGYDLAYLNRAAPEPLGAMIYVMGEPEIRLTYQEWTKLTTEPVSAQGLALKVEDMALLSKSVHDGLTAETRQRLWQAARELLPDPSRACARILDRIRADVVAVNAPTAGNAK